MIKFLQKYLNTAKHHPRRGGLEILKYIGPGLLVTVGFIDPGNWASNLAAGSEFVEPLRFPQKTVTIQNPLPGHFAAGENGSRGIGVQSDDISPLCDPGLSRLLQPAHLAVGVGKRMNPDRRVDRLECLVRTAHEFRIIFPREFGVVIGHQVGFVVDLVLPDAPPVAGCEHLQPRFVLPESLLVKFIFSLSCSYLFSFSDGREGTIKVNRKSATTLILIGQFRISSRNPGFFRTPQLKVLFKTKFILGQNKEDKSGVGELPPGNDRLTVCSLTQLLPKRNKPDEVYFASVSRRTNDEVGSYLMVMTDRGCEVQRRKRPKETSIRSHSSVG